MSTVSGSAHEKLEKKAAQSIEDTVDRLRRQVLEKAHQIRLPGYARKSVEQIDRGYFRGRKLLFFGPPRFHPEVRAFLPILLLDDACDNQRLRDKLREYSRYLAANYIWCWCVAPVTTPLRMQARDLLLREGESGFGETPLAGPMAFIRYHYRMMDLETLTDFGVLYNQAYSLEQNGFFKNRNDEMTSHFEQFKEHAEEAEQAKEQVQFIAPRGTKQGRTAETGEIPETGDTTEASE